MANDKTDYLEAAVIDYFLRPGASAPTRPTSVKVGLIVTDTNAEAGTVTEASYAGYAALDAGFAAIAQFARSPFEAIQCAPALDPFPLTRLDHVHVVVS